MIFVANLEANSIFSSVKPNYIQAVALSNNHRLRCIGAITLNIYRPTNWLCRNENKQLSKLSVQKKRKQNRNTSNSLNRDRINTDVQRTLSRIPTEKKRLIRQIYKQTHVVCEHAVLMQLICLVLALILVWLLNRNKNNIYFGVGQWAMSHEHSYECALGDEYLFNAQPMET